MRDHAGLSRLPDLSPSQCYPRMTYGLTFVSQQNVYWRTELGNDRPYVVWSDIKCVELICSESMRNYFSQFGEVIECTVMRDQATGRSRGFGFLTFKEPKCVNMVMVKEHQLDGKLASLRRIDRMKHT